MKLSSDRCLGFPLSISSLPIALLCCMVLLSCQADEEPVSEPAVPVEEEITTPSANEQAPLPEAFEAMVNSINDLRAQGCTCGGEKMPPVGPLKWNKALAIAAQNHSEDMAKASRLNHKGTDGSTAGDRIKRVGYNWRSYGENIAQGYDSAAAALQGWIASPGHCKNLMKEDFTEIGVAENKRFWTQVFAQPF